MTFCSKIRLSNFCVNQQFRCKKTATLFLFPFNLFLKRVILEFQFRVKSVWGELCQKFWSLFNNAAFEKNVSIESNLCSHFYLKAEFYFTSFALSKAITILQCKGAHSFIILLTHLWFVLKLLRAFDVQFCRKMLTVASCGNRSHNLWFLSQYLYLWSPAMR